MLAGLNNRPAAFWRGQGLGQRPKVFCKVYNKNVGKMQNKIVVKPTFLFCLFEYIGILSMEVDQYAIQFTRRTDNYG